MAGNLLDFLAAKISFLKIFLFGVKNAGLRHGNPEMKIPKMSFLWLWTENDDLFQLRNIWNELWNIFRPHYKFYQILICFRGQIVGSNETKLVIDDPNSYLSSDLSLTHISTRILVIEEHIWRDLKYFLSVHRFG